LFITLLMIGVWGRGRGTLHSSQFWAGPKIFRLNCLSK